MRLSGKSLLPNLSYESAIAVICCPPWLLQFFLFQGEVEQIAMMKPKALTEHESGMLEYLEDIIGTSRYKVRNYKFDLPSCENRGTARPWASRRKARFAIFVFKTCQIMPHGKENIYLTEKNCRP